MEGELRISRRVVTSCVHPGRGVDTRRPRVDLLLRVSATITFPVLKPETLNETLSFS
jgi:hypothetical protein